MTNIRISSDNLFVDFKNLTWKNHELNYYDQKIQRTPMHDIQKHWTAVSTLLGLISSVYRDVHHQRDQTSDHNRLQSQNITTKPIAAQLPWLVGLVSLVCDMDRWLSRRVLAQQSVVVGSISSGGDHCIHCWGDLIRSKQLSSVSVCRA